MPYIITKVNNRSSGKLRNIPLARHEIERLHNDGNCYTVVNIATRRATKFGNGCKREGRLDGIFDIFKKKPKQLPRDPRKMAQTVMYVPGAKGMSSRAQNSMRGAKTESYAAYKRRMKRIAERARRNPRFVPYRAAPYERD